MEAEERLSASNARLKHLEEQVASESAALAQAQKAASVAQEGMRAAEEVSFKCLLDCMAGPDSTVVAHLRKKHIAYLYTQFSEKKNGGKKKRVCEWA